MAHASRRVATVCVRDRGRRRSDGQVCVGAFLVASVGERGSSCANVRHENALRDYWPRLGFELVCNEDAENNIPSSQFDRKAPLRSKRSNHSGKGAQVAA